MHSTFTFTCTVVHTLTGNGTDNGASILFIKILFRAFHYDRQPSLSLELIDDMSWCYP